MPGFFDQPSRELHNAPRREQEPPDRVECNPLWSERKHHLSTSPLPASIPDALFPLIVGRLEFGTSMNCPKPETLSCLSSRKDFAPRPQGALATNSAVQHGSGHRLYSAERSKIDCAPTAALVLRIVRR